MTQLHLIICSVFLYSAAQAQGQGTTTPMTKPSGIGSTINRPTDNSPQSPKKLTSVVGNAEKNARPDLVRDPKPHDEEKEVRQDFEKQVNDRLNGLKDRIRKLEHVAGGAPELQVKKESIEKMLHDFSRGKQGSLENEERKINVAVIELEERIKNAESQAGL